MTTPAFSLIDSLSSWEGRIVNGKYPLLTCLDGRNQPAVYLTENNGAKAILKLISADASDAAAQVASWKLAGRLSHPALVRVYDTGLWHADDEQDMHFAVMEYCDESLAGVLRQRALTPGEVRQMLPPTLDALKYLHTQGVLHGELSPSNVMATGDQLKLSVDALGRTGDNRARAGLTPYDSPEAALGTTSLSSDLWSLGIVLHEALTRQLPQRDKAGNPEVAEKLTAPFDEIVKGCLTADRQRRLSLTAIRGLLDRPAPELVRPQPAPSAPAVPASGVAAVRPAAATQPTEAAREELRPGKPSAGRRSMIVAASALAILIALLVALRLSDSARKSPPSTTAQPRVAVTQPAPRPKTAAERPVTPSQEASAGSPVQQVLPTVSGKARSTIDGTVKVKVRVAVGSDGKVTRATLASRGPSAYFARQSLEAARRWTFAPPTRGGTPQASEWTLRFEFRRSGTKAAAQRS